MPRSSPPAASTNYGSLTTTAFARTRQSAPINYRSYLRFTVSGLSGAPTSVRLRLYVTEASADGGTAYPTGSSWTEAGLTWTNRPAASGGALGSAGRTPPQPASGSRSS